MAKGNEMADPERIERSPGLSRRRVLRGGLLGAAGLAAAALLGCTQDDGARTVPAPAKATGTGNGATSRTAAQPEATVTTTPAPDRLEELSEAELARLRCSLTRHYDWPYPYQFPEPAPLTPKPGGTMSIAATFDVGTMDPAQTVGGGSVTVQNMVYNRLLGMVGGVHKDPFWVELEPELAASWERSPDGVTFTFDLRDDIRWQISRR